jgi:hypothetical protein
MTALLALPVIAQQKGKGGDDDPDRAVKGGNMPAGWSVRPDRGTPSQINFTESGGVYHFVMGPAGTFYNSSWTKTGDYKFSARLTQAKAPSHPTSYGLMFGGSNLNTASPTYTYFLVRNTGDYYIANWEGASPRAVVNWTVHQAIARQGADGKQTNTLGVEVQADNVIFTVNGTEVRRLQKSQVHTDGLFAFRIGHNLDVDVDQISR